MFWNSRTLFNLNGACRPAAIAGAAILVSCIRTVASPCKSYEDWAPPGGETTGAGSSYELQ